MSIQPGTMFLVDSGFSHSLFLQKKKACLSLRFCVATSKLRLRFGALDRQNLAEVNGPLEMLSQVKERPSSLFTSKSKLHECYGKLTNPTLLDF